MTWKLDKHQRAMFLNHYHAITDIGHNRKRSSIELTSQNVEWALLAIIPLIVLQFSPRQIKHAAGVTVAHFQQGIRLLCDIHLYIFVAIPAIGITLAPL